MGKTNLLLNFWSQQQQLLVPTLLNEESDFEEELEQSMQLLGMSVEPCQPTFRNPFRCKLQPRSNC